MSAFPVLFTRKGTPLSQLAIHNIWLYLLLIGADDLHCLPLGRGLDRFLEVIVVYARVRTPLVLDFPNPAVSDLGRIEVGLLGLESCCVSLLECLRNRQ